MHDTPGRVRTAVFVDFDNIYLGLRDQDPKAAEAFANNVDRWDNWIRESLPLSGSAPARRDILMRRCYLNPRSFHHYRSFFTLSAYEVRDCPPLTAGGKTSTDIHMVMDILDALGHETRFDEFVLLSGDADFTPVLVRLRAHDRRTAVLAVGPASAAYKKSCDCLIDVDDFLGDATGHAPPADAFGDVFLNRVADAVLERASRFGRVERPELLNVFLRFSEFKGSNWFGHYGQESLVRHLCRLRPDLAEVNGALESAARARPSAPDGAEGSAEGRDGACAPEALRGRIVQAVEEIVKASPHPLPLAKLANEVRNRLGEEVRATNYAGAGTFKALLQAADLPTCRLTTGGLPYVYDPERHQAPAAPGGGAIDPDVPGLDPFARRVHQITGAPLLSGADYEALFRAIFEEVRNTPYSRTGTSKAVRDACAGGGVLVARADVSHVLQGLYYAGAFQGTATPAGPEDLARAFARNVEHRCREAELRISDEERSLLNRWLVDGAAPAPAEATRHKTSGQAVDIADLLEEPPDMEFTAP